MKSNAVQQTKVKQQKQDRIKAWSASTPEAFLQWVADIKPRILMNANYEIWVPTETQLYHVHEILRPAPVPIDAKQEPVKKLKRARSARKARPRTKDKLLPKSAEVQRQSSFKHNLSLIIAPRRHGKSTVIALIILWLFTSRRNLVVQLLGNTESHTRRAMYSMLRKIIVNTPSLRKLIPDKNIFVFEILFPALGNCLQMSPGNTPGTSFGEKIDVLWCSDLHASADLSAYYALQASLLDSKDSLCLIDTNVDFVGGVVDLLQQEAQDDPGIFCHHTQYENIDDYIKNCVPWIERSKAVRLGKSTLEVDFFRDILGRRSSAKNSLFPSEVIELCKTAYKCPVASIEELTQGRAYFVGGGLDRSKSLLGAVMGADNTVLTSILKVANPKSEEPEIYLLDQQVIIPNTSRTIKKAILKNHQKYKYDNLILEDYEIVDLLPWLEAQGIPTEKMTAHSTRQNASFPELARIAREGRLHFPEDDAGLVSELSTFSYTQRKVEGYHFGHSSKKFKDDRVFSLNWAIFALRSQIISLFTLGHIQCTSKRKNRHLCFLMGGNMELLCAEGCEAAQAVFEFYRQFLRYQLDSDLLLHEFYKNYVKLVGVKVYQAI